MRFLIYIFVYFFLFNFNSNAFEIKNANSAKILSKTSYKINDTNLVDEDNAENILDEVKDLNAALIIKSKEIQKNNKNRKLPKHKGGADIYNEYSDIVVFIGNRKKNKINTIGSGIIVDKNGIKVITNWHVIDNADSINVWLKPLKLVDENYLIESVDSFAAKLISIDKTKDLAMLAVNGLKKKVKPLKFAKFQKIRIGEYTFAIGHPKGLLWNISGGIVSQKKENHNWDYKDSKHNANVVQTDAKIRQGNSGGPLFNKDKELIGINTFTYGEGLNFAVSSDDVLEFINAKPKLIKKKKNKYIQKKNKGNTWIQKKKKKKLEKGTLDLSDAIEADYNNNGVIDLWLKDDNNNGIYEIAYGDPNEDGIIDVYAIDKNEDDNFEVVLFDTNSNGDPDKAEIDEDEDGRIDVVAYDYNEDGEWDKFENV